MSTHDGNPDSARLLVAMAAVDEERDVDSSRGSLLLLGSHLLVKRRQRPSYDVVLGAILTPGRGLEYEAKQQTLGMQCEARRCDALRRRGKGWEQRRAQHRLRLISRERMWVKIG